MKGGLSARWLVLVGLLIWTLDPPAAVSATSTAEGSKFLTALIIITGFVFVICLGLIKVIWDLSEMSIHVPPEVPSGGQSEPRDARAASVVQRSVRYQPACDNARAPAKSGVRMLG